MTTWINRYKVKTGKEEKQLANVLYDFVIVAIASLIFNGFIVNSHSSNLDQKVFMVLNAGLLTTHWYARTFFSQRYEKKGMDFRALGFISIFSLGAMAIAIDLMVFSKNQSTQEFLNRASIYIWLAGYMLSRLLVSFNYFMSAIANKNNRSLYLLTIYKSISRLAVVVLAAVFMILLSTGIERDVLIYTFLPLFLLIEYIGNVAFVTEKVLKGAPSVSYTSLRDRYSKINNVLISAFVISGSIQFAFYFKDASDMMMLLRVSLVYIIAFALWWTYSNRVYRFAIKKMAKTHVLLGATNIVIAGSLALMGGMIINAYNDVNAVIIIPTSLFALVVFLIFITINLYTFTNENTHEVFNKKIKIIFVAQIVAVIIPLLAIAITSLFIDYSVYVMYGMVIGSLAWTALSARYLIIKRIKPKKVSPIW